MTPEDEAERKKLEQELEELDALYEAGGFREIWKRRYITGEEVFRSIANSAITSDQEIEALYRLFKIEPEYENVKRFFEDWKNLPRERKEVALYEFYKQDFK